MLAYRCTTSGILRGEAGEEYRSGGNNREQDQDRAQRPSHGFASIIGTTTGTSAIEAAAIRLNNQRLVRVVILSRRFRAIVLIH